MADPIDTVPGIVRGRAQDIDLHGAIVPLCSRCLDGAGGICHTPGCILCRSAGPDIPIREMVDHHTEDGIAKLTALLDAERLARQTAERERDEAQAEASNATMAAAVGEAVIATLRGEDVSDFAQSFGPVMEAQTIVHTIALLRGDNDVLWRVVRDACAHLRVTDDDEADWPKLPAYAKAIVEERDEARAMAPRWERLVGSASHRLQLYVGNARLEGSQIAEVGELVLDSVADVYFDNIEDAARAVCARLGLPCIEVPRE